MVDYVNQVLEFLEKNDGKSRVSDIASGIDVSKATVSRIIDKLESEGIVGRESIDGRSKNVILKQRNTRFREKENIKKETIVIPEDISRETVIEEPFGDELKEKPERIISKEKIENLMSQKDEFSELKRERKQFEKLDELSRKQDKIIEVIRILNKREEKVSGVLQEQVKTMDMFADALVRLDGRVVGLEKFLARIVDNMKKSGRV